MEQQLTERRRSPWVSAENRMIMALHVSVPVRLLGLNSDGLLLSCKVPLRVGSTVRVVTEVAGRRIEVELCVDHVSNRPDEGVGGYVLGGRLAPFDSATRRTITALLGASIPCIGDEPARRTVQRRSEIPACGGVRRRRPVRAPEHRWQQHAPWVSFAP